MGSPLSSRSAAAVRRAIARLTPPRRGLPLAELVRLGADAGVALELDLVSARRIGVPVVVLREPAAPPPAVAALSRREREVAALVAKGRRNREIARALHIAEATVKDHVHHILAKLGLRSRTELTALLARR